MVEAELVHYVWRLAAAQAGPSARREPGVSQLAREQPPGWHRTKRELPS